MANNNNLLFCLLLILIIGSCDNADNRNSKDEYILDSIRFSSLESDSIRPETIFTNSDLSWADSLYVEYYSKGSSFTNYLKSTKAKISKQKPIGRDSIWTFRFTDNSVFNVKYDLLFIIPHKKDSDYYYLFDVALESQIISYGDSSLHKIYFLDKYTINNLKCGPTARKLTFNNPYKIRLLSR